MRLTTRLTGLPCTKLLPIAVALATLTGCLTRAPEESPELPTSTLSSKPGAADADPALTDPATTDAAPTDAPRFNDRELLDRVQPRAAKKKSVAAAADDWPEVDVRATAPLARPGADFEPPTTAATAAAEDPGNAIGGRAPAGASSSPGLMRRLPAEAAALPEPEEVPMAAAPEAAGAGPDESAAAATEIRPFETVRVFYGTNRQPVMAATLAWLGPWLPISAALAAAGICLVILGLLIGNIRHKLSKAIVGVVFVPIILWATTAAYETFPVLDRLAYGARIGRLQTGVAEVTIPRTHEVGKIERPSLIRLEVSDDPSKHITIASIEPLDTEAFAEELRRAVESSPREDAFVFVHGYNVSFDDAAYRTAQIAHDLQWQGAACLFSWPSRADLLDYFVDARAAAKSTGPLREFLDLIRTRSEARTIHLIAHSMGNRPLTAALAEIANSAATLDARPASRSAADRPEPMFNEVVLTAPDVDADVFINELAPAIRRVSERVTLYASNRDLALQASYQINRKPRLGSAGANLLVLPGVQTIDVSAIDTSFLGHNYYGDNILVLTDLAELLQTRADPLYRHWLRPAEKAQGMYWVFQAPTAEMPLPAAINLGRRSPSEPMR